MTKNNEIFDDQDPEIVTCWRWLDWVLRNRRAVLTSIACGIATCIVALPFWKRTFRHQPGVYLAADVEMEAFLHNQELTSQDCARVSELLQGDPGLLGKFGASIAQRLMEENVAAKNWTDGNEVIRSVLARLSSFSPLHAQFARTSMLLRDGHVEEALATSLELEKCLSVLVGQEGMCSELDVLRAFNLLRIAQTYQHLGHVDEERSAWVAFKAAAGWDRTSPYAGQEGTGFVFLEQNFSKNGVGLREYIAFREKQLAELAHDEHRSSVSMGP